MWNTTRSNQSTKQDIYAIVKVNYIYKMYIEIRISARPSCLLSVFNSYQPDDILSQKKSKKTLDFVMV